jgi:hypothetical protein
MNNYGLDWFVLEVFGRTRHEELVERSIRKRRKRSSSPEKTDTARPQKPKG